MIRVETKEKVSRLIVLFDWFIIYSFLGWLYETIYCSFNTGSFSERGFLFGPVCPIYGVCVVIAVLLFAERIKRNTTLFFLCACLATTVEYVVSVGLEYIFGRRWWDYSDQLYNLNGRICLGAAIVFGLMGILIIRYFHPRLQNFLNENVNENFLQKATRVVLTIFIFDLFVTLKINL